MDSSFLAAAAGKGDPSGADAVVLDVVEPSPFTADERAQQRRFCARVTCERGRCPLPVLADFAWGRTRSRLATVLVLVQVFSQLILQQYLPLLGLPAVAPCGYALVSASFDPNVTFSLSPERFDELLK